MDGERLTRFISGQCTAEERAEIETWIAEEPSRQELVASLAAVWALTDPGDASWNVDTAWRAFLERRSVPLPGASDRFTARASGRRPIVAWALRAAAAAVLVAGGAALWNLADRELAPDVSIAQEYTTEPGQQTEVRLPDATVVTLAPASRLSIVAAFGEEAREVHLEGQALFQVTHDPQSTFRVVTADGLTEVLGTRFVVRAYAEDSATSVALAEGSVRLVAPNDNGGARAVTLRPGQIGHADRGAVRIASDEDVVPFLSWAEGQLVFGDTRLGDAARDLSRWYDIDIRFADAALAERRLTASFRGEPIDQVLDLIALSLDLRYERSGRAIVFSTR
jgi:ferric-dicitrate binding protein FerR (iron transport regulator)